MASRCTVWIHAASETLDTDSVLTWLKIPSHKAAVTATGAEQRAEMCKAHLLRDHSLCGKPFSFDLKPATSCHGEEM
jgi:hypothetical protein